MWRMKRLHAILIFSGCLVVAWQCLYVFDWKPTLNNLVLYSDLLEQKLKPQEGIVRLSSNDSDNNNRESSEHYTLMNEYANQVLTDGGAQFRRILFWNEAYGSKNYGVGLGRDALRKAGCPVWQCETSDDRHNVSTYDAVLFHLRSWTRTDLPRRRSAHQRYVFWSIESAAWRSTDDTNMMRNFFNWTMTYRWDSDIVTSYGWIEPNGNGSSAPLHPIPEEMERYLDEPSPVNYAEGKTKMAAWFVSNCNSKSGRQDLVKHLKRYLDVDVFGNCGSMQCSKDNEEDCRKMAAKTYKFYMSLENSLCLDYITEKFFGMMHHPIIPIVVDVHGHHKRIAPPHSYINAADFNDVKELTNYLILLDKNETLYNQYFWWKPYYHVRDSEFDLNRGMCHLCASLHDTSLPTKVYHDMTDWWDKQASCKTIHYTIDS